MAAKEEDSLSLDGSITFDKTEDQDSPPVTARSFMYNARTPISLTRTVLDSARRRDAAGLYGIYKNATCMLVYACSVRLRLQSSLTSALF